jgi:hypothetical protein
MPAPIPQAAITAMEAAYARIMVKFLPGKFSRSVNS